VWNLHICITVQTTDILYKILFLKFKKIYHSYSFRQKLRDIVLKKKGRKQRKPMLLSTY